MRRFHVHSSRDVYFADDDDVCWRLKRDVDVYDDESR